jgi:hypothetical protein
LCDVTNVSHYASILFIDEYGILTANVSGNSSMVSREPKNFASLVLHKYITS